MLWAISDLHLPGGTGKRMDVFGEAWAGHASRIEEAWRASVGADDVVLVPGDLSWASRPAGAMPDLAFLGSLPGRKYITRGNHDYWWKSLASVREMLPAGIEALLNSAVDAGGFVLCAARGWTLPSSEFFVEDRDRPILEKEMGRLGMAVESALGIDGGPRVAMMHFPPTEDGGRTAFTDILAGAGIDACVFGHLHGEVRAGLSRFELDGVDYVMCSADQVGFAPVPVLLGDRYAERGVRG